VGKSSIRRDIRNGGSPVFRCKGCESVNGPLDSAFGKLSDFVEGSQLKPSLHSGRFQESEVAKVAEATQELATFEGLNGFEKPMRPAINALIPALSDVAREIRVEVISVAGHTDVDDEGVAGDLPPAFGENLLREVLATEENVQVGMPVIIGKGEFELQEGDSASDAFLPELPAP
jgi:hypothetical protein